MSVCAHKCVWPCLCSRAYIKEDEEEEVIEEEEMVAEEATHTSIATVSFTPEPEMEVYGEVVCFQIFSIFII